jgi:hypothetical protein
VQGSFDSRSVATLLRASLRMTSDKVGGSKFPGTCTREKVDHRGHGEDAVTLADGKKFNERGHGENSLMTTFQGRSAGVLRLALGRYASSRVAQDDKQMG